MAKKSNWELLKSQDERDTTRYRDVYSDQQLERSKIDEKQSPVSRIVLVLIAALFTVAITYLVCCAVEGIGAQFSGITGGLDSSVSSEEAPVGSENVVTFDPEDESTYYLATLEQWKSLVGVESHIDINGMGWKFADGTICGYTELEDYYQEWLKSVTPAELLEQEPDDSETGSSLSPVPGFNLGMYMAPSLWKVGAALLAGLLVVSILYPVMMRNLDAQNIMSDVVDINQYPNDQHVALPEEIQEKFDWFPDAGAHCPVQVSSMISHMALSNKGLKTVEVAERAEKDEYDEDGNLLYLKGELHLDENGEPIIHTAPLIDAKFMDALFDASGAPKNKEFRKKYDTTKIEYNIGNQNRGKVKDCDYVSDMINKTWSLPLYEPQRPAGAYLVDTEPVNTMVLAITRAGKGQTVIEPTIDMWTREDRPNNMVINDPKGELLVKNYVKGTVRGFQIVQFNLINSMKTDIYNPLGLAADAAREGDFIKCAQYVENIADVFFPLDGGDDPVWPNAANNAFKRAAYGLIDYYLEEEKELRIFADRTQMDPKVLDAKIDEMWGKVTLYNCYQLFVQLTSKKLANPLVEWKKYVNAGNAENLSDEEYSAKEAEAELLSSLLWDDKPEADLLTLFFTATDVLPKNQMRTLVSNANNALKSMAGAEKMLASVYGIAITAMVRDVCLLKAGTRELVSCELAA